MVVRAKILGREKSGEGFWSSLDEPAAGGVVVRGLHNRVDGGLEVDVLLEAKVVHVHLEVVNDLGVVHVDGELLGNREVAKGHHLLAGVDNGGPGHRRTDEQTNARVKRPLKGLLLVKKKMRPLLVHSAVTLISSELPQSLTFFPTRKEETEEETETERDEFPKPKS